MTVSAIIEATIHILLDGGLDRFSTTRVAARAGASVGSLYQYFPNRESLLVSALERHLIVVVSAIEQACRNAVGLTTMAIVHQLVDSFVDAKFANVNASKALYAVSADAGGLALVRQMSLRAQRAVCDVLATASDSRFVNLSMIGFVICTTMVGPVQGALEVDADDEMVNAVRQSLKTMIGAYLLSARI